MPNIKLRYFNAKGFGEVIRLTLAQAGVEYEDIRFEREQWNETEKAKAPGGVAPYLEVDGKLLGQSMACARYIAKEHGMMGKDAWEEAKINEVTDTFHDLIMQFAKIYYAKNDEDKVEAKGKIQTLLVVLEGMLKSHNDGQGFFVGDKVSLADIKAFSTLEVVSMLPDQATVMDAFPLLKAHFDRIASLDRIQAWLKKRPVTER